jgi:hypothetical protein
MWADIIFFLYCLLLSCRMARAAAVAADPSLQIHLVSVNQKVGEAGLKSFKEDLTSCAIEAAARVAMAVPGASVIMHATDNEGWRNKNAALFELSPVASYVAYHNVNMEWLFTDTPMHDWWHSGAYKEWNFVYQTLSNAARVAMVHKLGGMYIDNDVVLLNAQVLNESRQGALSWSHAADNKDDQINNSPFAFPQNSLFTQLWMERWIQWCPKDLTYGQCGPVLLNQFYYDTCKGDQILSICNNFKLWRKEELTPITWENHGLESTVRNASQEEYNALLSNGMKAFHWYSSGHGDGCISSTSIISRVMAQGCPLVHATLGRYWCENQ